jgi:hypothetical protein
MIRPVTIVLGVVGFVAFWVGTGLLVTAWRAPTRRPLK